MTFSFGSSRSVVSTGNHSPNKSNCDSATSAKTQARRPPHSPEPSLGYDKLEIRLQERDLQLARLQRIVSQKNKVSHFSSCSHRPAVHQDHSLSRDSSLLRSDSWCHRSCESHKLLIRILLLQSVQEDIQSLVSALDDFQVRIPPLWDTTDNARRTLMTESLLERDS
jgi:hypothetical protein